MVGRQHAKAIFAVENTANFVLAGHVPFATAVDMLMKDFADEGPVRVDFERELLLTMWAPYPMASFPPSNAIEAIKVNVQGTCPLYCETCSLPEN